MNKQPLWIHQDGWGLKVAGLRPTKSPPRIAPGGGAAVSGRLAGLLLGYMPARTHSSQSADLVTGGGASSPADDPAACLPLPKAKCSCEGTRGTGLQTRLSRLASR
jgi:hypothetical protein